MNKIALAKTLLANILIIVMLELVVGGVIVAPWLLLPAVTLALIIMFDKTEIKVKYFNPHITPLSKISVGDWIDLRSAETVKLKAGEHKLIRLGVGMILPDGYEAHVLPRSSTFKNWGVLMTNSMGIIDNSYSGDGDEWLFPVYATRDTVIGGNERICQFRIMKSQPSVRLKTVKKLRVNSRGGFGSTGKA